MNTNPPIVLNQELLNDFFSEADEHLVGIRRGLGQLELTVGKSAADAAVVESLFRNFHSFKGLSAFVNLASAEAIAHAAEDFLRLLRAGNTALTEEHLETLLSATQKLEQIVAAFHSHAPLPEHEALLAHLGRLCSQSRGQADAPAGLTHHAPAPRGPLWKFTFSPSQKLDADGINVTTIRQEISQLGEITKSAPLVIGPGKVAFEFFVSVEFNPDSLPHWQAKGVTVEKADPGSSASTGDSLRGAVPTGEDAHNPFLAPSHLIRVDLQRLDDLMRITGEMMIHRSRLDVQLARLSGPAGNVDLSGVQEASGGLGRSLRELSAAIMRVRLVPVAEIFERMPFVIRDLARQSSKKARIVLAGQDTAIDKYLIERLKEPLLHLVRNAFSHGVETTEERVTASKPEEAVIELRAAMSGDSVILQIRDDGAGINPKAIFRRAKKLGMEIPDSLDSAAILKILCASGFSTRDDADRASGRGVGMAVVQATMRELGGELSLESEPGKGTAFTLRLPLTLAIAETFIITAGGQTYAVPQGFVTNVLEVTESQIQSVNRIEVIPYKSGVLPVVRLARIFGLKEPPRPKMCALVIAFERGSIGLIADRVLGRREVVVHALRDPLVQVRGVAGATELGDGKPVLILDGASFMGENVRPPETDDENNLIANQL